MNRPSQKYNWHIKVMKFRKTRIKYNYSDLQEQKMDNQSVILIYGPDKPQGPSQVVLQLPVCPVNVFSVKAAL